MLKLYGFITYLKIITLNKQLVSLFQNWAELCAGWFCITEQYSQKIAQ